VGIAAHKDNAVVNLQIYAAWMIGNAISLAEIWDGDIATLRLTHSIKEGAARDIKRDGCVTLIAAMFGHSGKPALDLLS